MKPILGKNIFPILRSTLNRLDGRLVDHGERVAYLVCHMLRQMGCPARRMLDLCILAVLQLLNLIVNQGKLTDNLTGSPVEQSGAGGGHHPLFRPLEKHGLKLALQLTDIFP